MTGASAVIFATAAIIAGSRSRWATSSYGWRPGLNSHRPGDLGAEQRLRRVEDVLEHLVQLEVRAHLGDDAPERLHAGIRSGGATRAGRRGVWRDSSPRDAVGRPVCCRRARAPCGGLWIPHGQEQRRRRVGACEVSGGTVRGAIRSGDRPVVRARDRGPLRVGQGASCRSPCSGGRPRRPDRLLRERPPAATSRRWTPCVASRACRRRPRSRHASVAARDGTVRGCSPRVSSASGGFGPDRALRARRRGPQRATSGRLRRQRGGRARCGSRSSAQATSAAAWDRRSSAWVTRSCSASVTRTARRRWRRSRRSATPRRRRRRRP